MTRLARLAIADGVSINGGFSGEPVEAQFLMATIPRMAKPTHGWIKGNRVKNIRKHYAGFFADH